MMIDPKAKSLFVKPVGRIRRADAGNRPMNEDGEWVPNTGHYVRLIGQGNLTLEKSRRKNTDDAKVRTYGKARKAPAAKPQPEKTAAATATKTQAKPATETKTEG